MTQEHAPTESRALAAIRDLIESGRPLAYLHSSEERRVVSLLRQAASTLFATPASLFTWSLTDGLQRDGTTDAGEPLSPRAVLDHIAGAEGPAIFLLKDIHEALRDEPDVRRRLRDLYEVCLDRGILVVVSAPVKAIPDEIAPHLVYVELAVPDLAELVEFLRREAETITAAGGTVDTSDATLQQLGRALQGLGLDDAHHAIRRALVGGNTLDAGSLPALLEEKRLLVNRTGMIEFVPMQSDLENVGGLSILKNWLMERRKLFELRDSLAAELVPKGVLVMGVSGCGKSLSIKAIASCFELPLYRIDMIEVFSGRHGSAEGAFVRACHMLESMAPAVVWFDEIEAGINSQAKEGELGRIFGFFLTWMQEKTRGLFVGATANRIDLLPAEMIRKGRFDEVFFVDLPLDDERIDVFGVHLRQRGLDPADYDLEPLKRMTKGWTGAEIEQCVVAALTTVHLEERSLTADDLYKTASRMVPLSKTMKEQVEHIRNWAFNRAVRASPRG